MKQSEKIDQLAAALVKAQKDLKPAVKDSANPFFKSKYADLSSVWEACHLALENNGLAIIQLAVPAAPGNVGLETVILHSSGEWMSGHAEAPLVKNDPQSYGSATTYLRRYGLSAALGIMAEDDDAEGAMNRNRPTGQTVPIPKYVAPRQDVLTILTGIDKVTVATKLDKSKDYTIHAGEKYHTGNGDFAIKAKEISASGLIAKITYVENSSGREIKNIEEAPRA
jgi:hypothetical protein